MSNSKIEIINKNNIKKIQEIKKFLEVKELNKLEQGAIQGGSASRKETKGSKKAPQKDGPITSDDL